MRVSSRNDCAYTVLLLVLDHLRRALFTAKVAPLLVPVSDPFLPLCFRGRGGGRVVVSIPDPWPL